MRRFESLMRSFKVRCACFANSQGFASEVLAHQRFAEEDLPRLVVESGFRVWKPGDPVPQRGRRLLIGVAASSRYDLRLLDTLAQAARQGKTGGDQIDVFQFWLECKTPEQLEQYIPGMDLGTIFHTPVVGVWKEGAVVTRLSGAAAIDAVTGFYGLSAQRYR